MPTQDQNIDYGFGGSSPVNGYVTPVSQMIDADYSGLPVLVEQITISSTNANYVTINIAYSGTSVEWLKIGTTTNTGFVNGFSGTATLDPELINLIDLSAGNYNAVVSFTFYKSDGTNITRSTSVNLTLFGPPPIKTEKTNYQLIYNRQNDTLSGDKIINIENNDALDLLDFYNTSGLFTLTQDFTNTFTITEESAGKLANSLMLPASGTANILGKINDNTSGATKATFNIELVVIENDDLIILPNKLDFYLKKGNNETKSATLNIVNVSGKSFTVTTPSFVSSDISSGSASGNIVITTENSNVLAKGIFTGNIVIAYDAKTINIPVTVDNYSFLDIGLEELNFALDNKVLKTQKIDPDAVFLFIQLQMKFTTAEEKFTIAEEYQTAYFKNKTETDIGQIIQNFFPVYQNHIFTSDGKDFNNKLIYAPAEISISVQELDSDHNVKHTENLPDIKFFAGKKPKLFPLFTNHNVRRKFKNTNFILSYYSGLLSPADFSENALTSNPVAANSVQSVFINESKITLGKVEETINLEFLQIPENNENFMIQFLNQNLVPEGMIFNNDLKNQSEFALIYDNFKNGKKYSAEENEKFTINTGFILKEEVAVVKEIIKSRICFIKYKDLILKCFCTTEKLNFENQNLYNFDLNFNILANED